MPLGKHDDRRVRDSNVVIGKLVDDFQGPLHIGSLERLELVRAIRHLPEKASRRVLGDA